ncbi:autotransporter family protein [Methylobacter sp.]|uniref:autotransporter family protein n=1 Tax=Methylobacter sp. TaxID=2051955 RepID=UPI002FDDF455
MANTRRTKKIASTVAFTVSVAFSSSGQSADVNWTGPESGSTDWNIATNWFVQPPPESPQPPPENPQRIPIAGDNALLQFSNIINPTLLNTVQYVNPGNNPLLGRITISGDIIVDDGVVIGGDDMTLNHLQDALTASSLLVGGLNGRQGIYNLGGTGSLTASSEIIGNEGAGTFNQTGGSHSVTDTLTINSGGIYNFGGGTLTAGRLINSGTVNLSGAGTRILGANVTNQGAFNITNTTAQLTGTFNNLVGGSLTGGQVINSGTLNYSGGTINTNLTNTGTVNLSGTGSRIFDGDVTNQGTFKVTDTTAVYNGNFNNQGAYISDPSVNDFQNLNVGPQGFLAGGQGDTFIVRGNFANSSTQNTAWNTQQSNLVFSGSNGTQHQMALTSADLGPGANGFQNNFAWGHVTVDSGNSIVLVDGNGTPGAALYASTFTLGNGVSQLSSVSGNYNVYYDPSLPGNQYLSGNAFNFGNGIGQLIPQGFSFLPESTAPGFSVNVQGFGAALDSACPSATGELAERCRELRVLDSSQRQDAVASLTPIQQLSQVATPIKFNFARMDAPKLRMAQLRSGHVQPTSFSVNGYQIPLSKFASSLGSSARGGAAGDPNSADQPFRDKPFGVFVQGKVDYGNQANNPQSFGFNIDSRAVTVGTDYRFTDKLVAGAAIEYNNVHTRFNNSGGSMHTDTIMGSLYSSYYLPKDFYVDGLATVGNSKYALNRTFDYPGFSSSSTSSPNALQYAFAVTGGKDIAWRQWLFNPYTRFEYTQMEIDGYRESGGSGFAMDVGSQSVSSAISTVGTQVSYNFSQSWGILVPSARFEWEHQYLNNNQNTSMALASAAAGTGNFVIQSGKPDRDYVNLGASLAATLPGGGSAFLRYDTRLGQSYVSNHIVEVGVKIPF